MVSAPSGDGGKFRFRRERDAQKVRASTPLAVVGTCSSAEKHRRISSSTLFNSEVKTIQHIHTQFTVKSDSKKLTVAIRVCSKLFLPLFGVVSM